MMKKMISLFVMFLLVISPLAVAAEITDNCSGFWGRSKASVSLLFPYGDGVV